MDKRKPQTGLELTLCVLAAKAELDNLLIGLGDVELAAQYIWRAYELADTGTDKLTKKLLKRAYDSLNNGGAWKARELLEKIIDSKPCSEPDEF
jgi:hypothetical protein